jgi:hypothetical protein
MIRKLSGKKKRKKQIDINHTREGMGHSRQPAEQVESELWGGKRWKDERVLGAG